MSVLEWHISAPRQVIGAYSIHHFLQCRPNLLVREVEHIAYANGKADLDTEVGVLKRLPDGLGETNPTLSDSDKDGLPDNVETDTFVFVDADDTGSDPQVTDSDGDGLSDAEELAVTPRATDPNRADSDDDTLSDSEELNADPPSDPWD